MPAARFYRISTIFTDPVTRRRSEIVLATKASTKDLEAYTRNATDADLVLVIQERK